MRTSRVVSAFVLLAGLVLGLGGCRYYWFKPGTTQEGFAQDSEACLQEGRTWAAQQKYAVVNDQLRYVYRSCLASRGYERQKTTEGPDKYRGYEFDD
jgi:hypothetical protein